MGWKFFGAIIGFIFSISAIILFLKGVIEVEKFVGNTTPSGNLTEGENFIQFGYGGIIAFALIIVMFLVGIAILSFSVYHIIKQAQE